MGMLRVIWIVNLELQGGSPRLCRLRPASVEPDEQSFDYVLAHMRFIGVPQTE
jgi:hypothetical protein